MSSLRSRPPYDPELEVILRRLNFTPSIAIDDIDRVRKLTNPSADEVLTGLAIQHEERSIARPGGELLLSIFRPDARTNTASAFTTAAPSEKGLLKPCIYFIHGGGMFTGTRFLGVSMVLGWLEELDAICVSVEYRLAPEHPDPIPVEDCYSGLLWIVEHAADLGIDPANISVAGISAGGGLAAGVALLARDRGGPALRAQILECPMLESP